MTCCGRFTGTESALEIQLRNTAEEPSEGAILKADCRLYLWAHGWLKERGSRV